MTELLALLSMMLWLAPMQTDTAEPPPSNDETHITLRGQTYEIYPPEKLEARGVPVRYIPREDNAAYVYFDAIELMPEIAPDVGEALHDAASGKWPEGEVAEKLNAYLDACAPSMELARGASQMDYALPLFRGDSDSIYAVLLPSLSMHRKLSITLVADARRRIEKGDHEAGFNQLVSVQRMGNQLGHGSTMIEGLVGIAVGSLANNAVSEIAETHAIDSALLTSTIAEMDRLAEDVPTFEDLLAMEEAFSQNSIDDLIVSPGDIAMVSNLPTIGALPIEQTDSGWNKLAAALRRVYLPDRAIKRNIAHYYQQIRKVTRPHKDGTPRTIIEEDVLFDSIPAWDVVNQVLAPSLSHVYEVTLRNKSNFERAKLRVAVAAYKQDHGVEPATLQALVPQYIDRIEADPMTGYDFEYKSSPDRSGPPAGLEMITRDSAEALRKKRRTPAILTPRAGKWRRYVLNYIDRYELNETQRNSAEAILRDVEARAAAFERTQGARIKQLIDAGEDEKARKKMTPLDKLFDELTLRLDRLPTARQRAAVAQNDEAKEHP